MTNQKEDTNPEKTEEVTQVLELINAKGDRGEIEKMLEVEDEKDSSGGDDVKRNDVLIL